MVAKNCYFFLLAHFFFFNVRCPRRILTYCLLFLVHKKESCISGIDFWVLTWKNGFRIWCDTSPIFKMHFSGGRANRSLPSDEQPSFPIAVNAYQLARGAQPKARPMNTLTYDIWFCCVVCCCCCCCCWISNCCCCRRRAVLSFSKRASISSSTLGV